MSKPQELKKIIQKEIPEIMKLKFGCKVKYIRGGNHKKGVYIQEDPYEYYLFHTKYGDERVRKQRNRKFIESLGRPITLADVLRVVKERKGREFYYAHLEEIEKLWNLKKDYDGQSKKTIESLLKIIK